MKMTEAYYRPINKRIVEQKLRDYLEKTYGTFYVADEVTLGPYCSDWVQDVVKKKGELENLTQKRWEEQINGKENKSVVNTLNEG